MSAAKRIIPGVFLVKDIKEAPWNSNVMPADEYARLGHDMKARGLGAINPILIADLPIGRIAVDGSHRLRKARELGWKEIRTEMDPNIDSEEKARAIGYAKNTERGHQDPYKLAEYFAWFSDVKKMTHEQIAKQHNIDRTTVTRTLSLLNIAPDVKAKLANVTYVTMRHLEPFAAAPHHIQREVVKHINKREHSTVADVARCTRHITEEFEKRERLKKAVATAKFPKCPKCGKPPEDFGYQGGDYVRCVNSDSWSLSKGLERERPISSGPTTPTIPQSIKTERTIAEFAATFRKILAGILAHVDANGVENIHIRGRTKDGGKIDVSANFWEWCVSMDLESAEQTIDLNVSTCKIKDRPKIKTRIKTGGYIDSKQKLAKLERQVQDLFQKYGQRGRVKL